MSRTALPNRLQGGAIDRVGHDWRVWLHTPDHVHGTYLLLHADGKITRVTVRWDEGDDEFLVRPSDGDL